MKPRSLTPTVKSYEVQTNYTHSNLDNHLPTPAKGSASIRQAAKIKKLTNVNKSKGIPAKLTQIKYKCGCVGPKIQTRPANTIKIKYSMQIPLQNKRFHPLNKIKPSTSVQLLKPDSSHKSLRMKPKSSLQNIVRRINSLCDNYDDLLKEDTERSRRTGTIKYAPKEIIRSVDKIIKLDRPIERRVKKVKKIPKEIIKFVEVETIVDVAKQELIFVDAESPQPQLRYVDAPSHTVRQIMTSNSQNILLQNNLSNFRGRRDILTRQVENSRKKINQLRQSLVRARSQDVIPENPIGLAVRLEAKPDEVRNSIATTVNQSQQCLSQLIRSKSQPLGNSSIISFKSKMYINGKESNDLSCSVARSILVESPRQGQSQSYLRSSPEIKFQGRVTGSARGYCRRQCQQVCQCINQVFRVSGLNEY